VVNARHHGVMTEASDFFEPDEPVEKIITAFERGEKGRTRPPAQGRTAYLVVGAPSQGRTAYLAIQTAELAFLPLQRDTRLRNELTVDLVSR
jgi:hypothetical protein